MAGSQRLVAAQQLLAVVKELKAYAESVGTNPEDAEEVIRAVERLPAVSQWWNYCEKAQEPEDEDEVSRAVAQSRTVTQWLDCLKNVYDLVAASSLHLLTVDESRKLKELEIKVITLYPIVAKGGVPFPIRHRQSNCTMTGIALKDARIESWNERIGSWLELSPGWDSGLDVALVAAQTVIAALTPTDPPEEPEEPEESFGKKKDVSPSRGRPIANLPDLKYENRKFCLYYGSEKLHTFNGGLKARQLPFLREFQAAGWPAALQSSLEPSVLRRTVIDLNRSLGGKAIMFSIDEQGRATWNEASPH